MSEKHEVSCWQCHEMTSLETRNEFDGCCWACGAEIDLEEYLIQAMDKRDEHYAALSTVTAERDQLRAEVEALQMDRKACWEEFKALRRSSDATERELRAEVEALQKDAERYRWLADNACDVTVSASTTDYGDGDTNMGPRVSVDPQQYPTEFFGSAKQKLDAAIDAAMAAKEGGVMRVRLSEFVYALRAASSCTWAEHDMIKRTDDPYARAPRSKGEKARNKRHRRR